MADTSELRQIIKEIEVFKKEFKESINQEIDKRIDALCSFILSTNEAKSALDKEIEQFINQFEKRLNFVGHVSIGVSYFYARAFPPKYYIDRLIETYNSMDGYKAYLAEYSKRDTFAEDELYISKKGE